MSLGPTYYRDQLAQVNAAITKAEAAQAYQINSRSMTRPELGSLYRERKRLEPLARQEAMMAAGQSSTIRVSTSKGM